MVSTVHPTGAAAETMANGRGLRHLRMALGTIEGFRALRGATKGSAFGNRDFLKKSSKTFIFCLNTCHYPTGESVWKGPL